MMNCHDCGEYYDTTTHCCRAGAREYVQPYPLHPSDQYANLVADVVELKREQACLSESLDLHRQQQADVHGLTAGPTATALADMQARIDALADSITAVRVLLAEIGGRLDQHLLAALCEHGRASHGHCSICVPPVSPTIEAVANALADVIAPDMHTEDVAMTRDEFIHILARHWPKVSHPVKGEHGGMSKMYQCEKCEKYRAEVEGIESAFGGAVREIERLKAITRCAKHDQPVIVCPTCNAELLEKQHGNLLRDLATVQADVERLTREQLRAMEAKKP